MDFLRTLSAITPAEDSLVGTPAVLLAKVAVLSSAAEYSVAPTTFVTATAYRHFLDSNQLLPVIKSAWKAYCKARPEARHALAVRLRASLRHAAIPANLGATLSRLHKDLSGGKTARALCLSPEIIVPGTTFKILSITPPSSSGVFSLTEFTELVRQKYLFLFSDAALNEWLAADIDISEVSLALSIRSLPLQAKGVSGRIDTVSSEFHHQAVSSLHVVSGLASLELPTRALRSDRVLLFNQAPGASDAVIHYNRGKKATASVVTATGIKLKALSAAERAVPLISHAEATSLARAAGTLAKKFGFPLSVFWSRSADKKLVEIYRILPLASEKSTSTIKKYEFSVPLAPTSAILTGHPYGEKIASGRALVVTKASQLSDIIAGDIVVARQIMPEWTEHLRHVAGLIIEDAAATTGVELSHAYSIPVLTGAKKARQIVVSKKPITLSTLDPSQGLVYSGLLPFQVEEYDCKHHSAVTDFLVTASEPQVISRLSELPLSGLMLPVNDLSKNSRSQLVDRLKLAAALFFPRPVWLCCQGAVNPVELCQLVEQLSVLRSENGFDTLNVVVPPAAAADTLFIKRFKELGLSTKKSGVKIYGSVSYADLTAVLKLKPAVTGLCIDFTTLAGPLSEAVKRLVIESMRLARLKHLSLHALVGALPAQSDLLPLLIQEKIGSLAVAPAAWWRLTAEAERLEKKYGQSGPVRFFSSNSGRFQKLPERALSALGVVGLTVSLAGSTCQTVSQPSNTTDLQAAVQTQLATLKTELTQEITSQLAKQAATADTLYQESELARFTIRHPSTWSVTRSTAEVRFESGGTAFTISQTPTPKPLPPPGERSAWREFVVYRTNVTTEGSNTETMTIMPPADASDKQVIVLSARGESLENLLNRFESFAFAE